MDLSESTIYNCESHWYYLAKFKAIEKLLPLNQFSKVVDVGSGQKVFAKMLLKYTSIDTVYCIDINYKEDTIETYCSKQLYSYQKMPDSIEYDCVLMMDILEHIEDDIDFFNTYLIRSKPGTMFFITVPAFQWLFSGHDIYLQHFRRYSIKSLKQILPKQGICLKSISYFYNMIFPLAVVIRVINKCIVKFFSKKHVKSDMNSVPTILNKILIGLSKIDLLFLGKNQYFGLSVICVLQKDMDSL